MEWVLQVVDEIDDGVAALRHTWLGLRAQLAVGLDAAFPATTGVWEIELFGRRARS
jgi:hypothetical protein